MFTSILSQLVSMVCGLIVPRLMIGYFGSELYGATASITQFLSYITLLEGGIGGVARAALYKPLAENDSAGISRVYFAIKKFFNVVAIVFIAYTLVIGVIYKDIADISFFDRSFTFFLVLAISLSTLAQYFFGVANLTILNADQRQYIGCVSNIITVIINAIMVIILIKLDCNILVVKLCSSLIYILKPLVFAFYVRRNYKIDSKFKGDMAALDQKWSGLGQHIAFFLHSNTDVVVLTLLANLKCVSVYSVYSMVSTSIKSIVSAFTGGMEAVFGNMIAKKEYDNLKKAFGYYDTLISIVSIAFFSVAAALIVPFVKLYTAGITDANYIEPVFAILLIGAEFLYCLRLPYHSLTIAGNRFKQTRFAAYGEAAINIILSCALVISFGLIGVAIGTFCATLFRFIYYIFYLSRHVVHIKIGVMTKRFVVNIITFVLAYLLCQVFLNFITVNSYLVWALCGVVSVACAAAITLLAYIIFYKNDMAVIFKKAFGRFF